MSKRFIITIITLLIIVIAAGSAIFIAKGYSFSTKEKRIVGTGILTVTSEPDAASIFIDGHLTSATNATISSLPPKTYSIKVIKEGFISWEKSIIVKEGLVTEIKITLFPAIPTIYPLTFSGISNPVLSPDGGKLAYIVSSPSNKKNGIWVWTLSRNQPIAFVRSSEPHQIALNTVIDFSKATLRFSPDSKQLLATVGENNYLLESNSLNSDPRDITPLLSATTSSWDDDIKAENQVKILAIKDPKFRKIASDSAAIKWSPDETKFMVVKQSNKTGNTAKVYDLEEKGLADSSVNKEYDLSVAKAYYWLPDSRHIILVEDGTISLVEFDGTNKAIIYAGTFADSFVFPWPDSSRLVIISSSPTPTASEPNLYGINLK